MVVVAAVGELILHNRRVQMVDLAVAQLGILDILGVRVFLEKEVLALDHLVAILGQVAVVAQVRQAMALVGDMRVVAEEAAHTRVQQLPMQAAEAVAHILVLHPLTLGGQAGVVMANCISVQM